MITRMSTGSSRFITWPPHAGTHSPNSEAPAGVDVFSMCLLLLSCVSVWLRATNHIYFWYSLLGIALYLSLFCCSKSLHMFQRALGHAVCLNVIVETEIQVLFAFCMYNFPFILSESLFQHRIKFLSPLFKWFFLKCELCWVSQHIHLQGFTPNLFVFILLASGFNKYQVTN